MPITAHLLMNGPLGRKPRIHPMPPLPYLDEEVRASFNAWLLKTFGDDLCVIMLNGKMLVSERTLQDIRRDISTATKL